MVWQSGRVSENEHCSQVRSDAVWNGPKLHSRALRGHAGYHSSEQRMTRHLSFLYLFCLSNSFTTCSVTSKAGW